MRSTAPVLPKAPVRGYVLKVDDGKGELIWIEPEELGELDNKLKELYVAVPKQAIAIEDDKLDSALAEVQRL